MGNAVESSVWTMGEAGRGRASAGRWLMLSWGGIGEVLASLVRGAAPCSRGLLGPPLR